MTTGMAAGLLLEGKRLRREEALPELLLLYTLGRLGEVAFRASSRSRRWEDSWGVGGTPLAPSTDQATGLASSPSCGGGSLVAEGGEPGAGAGAGGEKISGLTLAPCLTTGVTVGEDGVASSREEETEPCPICTLVT